MKNKLSIFLFILTMGALSFGFAGESAPSSVNLSDLVQEALANNPRIKAAENQWKATAERIPQAKALPDPMVSFAYFGQSIETRLGPQRNKVSLSQKIPFFGKLALRENMARIETSVFEELYEQVKDEVTLQVKEAFYSLYWLDKAISINREEKEVLRRLSRTAQKKYEAGSASQQDVLKAQLEMVKVQEKIIQLQQAKKAAITTLSALLARDMGSDWGAAEAPGLKTPHLDLEQLQDWAQRESPEMRRASRHVEMGEEGLKLAKKNYYPDFNLMLDYVDIGGGTTNLEKDGRNAWMGAVGVNIPLFRKKLKAAEAEASLRLEASREMFADTRNDISFRISEIFYEIKTAEEQLELYEYSLIPQAEQSLKSSEIGYLAGKIDFLHLLESERMVLQLKLGYFKIQSGLGKSLARLERIVGKSIE